MHYSIAYFVISTIFLDRHKARCGLNIYIHTHINIHVVYENWKEKYRNCLSSPKLEPLIASGHRNDSESALYYRSSTLQLFQLFQDGHLEC